MGTAGIDDEEDPFLQALFASDLFAELEAPVPAPAPVPDQAMPVKEEAPSTPIPVPLASDVPLNVPVKAAGKPHYHGHRQRLRERFLKASTAENLDGVADYELLELLLFLAIPQRDVKPLAKELLAHFGGLGAVLSARPQDLMAFPGIKENTAVALKVVHAASLHMLREQVIEKPVLSSWNQLLDYCHASMAFRDIEQFRLLFLDRKNRLIADELQQRGTVDHTPVYPREVVRRGLELQASALIMVHNHPSGDPQPSKADLEMTTAIREALRHVSISLHDHLIISSTGYCSFKADGLL